MDSKIVKVRESKFGRALTIPKDLEDSIGLGYVECVACKDGIIYRKLKV